MGEERREQEVVESPSVIVESGGSIELVEVAVDLCAPNPWNVNRMDPAMEAKLAAYLKKEGLVEPIVVRPHPTAGAGHFEILGGYHRWKVCKDRLGYKTVPCSVVHLDDKRAKVLSVNLNSMHGDTVPHLLADLLHDLNQEISIADLETLLPFDAREIEDTLDLMRLPEGLDAMLEEEAKREEAAAPVVVSIVLDKRQNEVFEAALEAAKREVGQVKNGKARAVELMAQAYLRQVDAALSDAEIGEGEP